MTPRLLTRLALFGVAIVGLTTTIASLAPDVHVAFTLLSRRIGFAEIAAYLLYSLAALALPGIGWWVTTGEPVRRVGAFMWGRLVREAAADLLPFSQVGGIVLGAAEVASRGIPLALVYAGFIADLMTELSSQVVFTMFGAMIALDRADGRALKQPLVAIAIGVGVLLALIAATTYAPAILRAAQSLARHFIPTSAVNLRNASRRLHDIYLRRAALVTSFAINLLAWFVSAVGAYVLLQLVRVDVHFWPIIALESFIFLLRSTAFAIPGGLGIQETGYKLLGPMFGLPIEGVLAIMLFKRLRDVAIAGPVLVIWQIRRVVARRRATTLP